MRAAPVPVGRRPALAGRPGRVASNRLAGPDPAHPPGRAAPGSRRAGKSPADLHVPSARIRRKEHTERESHPPIHGSPGPARAAGPAPRTDAQPALVLACRHDGLVHRDRPGRPPARRPRPARRAVPGPQGAAGRARRRSRVRRPAGRRDRRPAPLPDRPALVPGRRRGRGTAPGGHRLLLARVRHHRGAAAVFRRPRHPGRRPPQGRQRSRRAADRGGPALPARVLHPVAVGRGLAERALPLQRPGRAAADAAAGLRRRRGAGQRGAGRRADAGGPDLGRGGRPGAAAAARLLRGGERAGHAGGHRPAVRRRQRPPAAAGTAARHRRGARAAGVLRDHRAPPARGVPHQRGARRLPRPGADERVRHGRA